MNRRRPQPPFGSSLIFTSATGTEYSITRSRYVAFIRAALDVNSHNLLTAELRTGQPEINLTHNWSNKQASVHEGVFVWGFSKEDTSE